MVFNQHLHAAWFEQFTIFRKALRLLESWFQFHNWNLEILAFEGYFQCIVRRTIDIILYEFFVLIVQTQLQHTRKFNGDQASWRYRVIYHGQGQLVKEGRLLGYYILIIILSLVLLEIT